ncbi:nuclear transport factor 2 family protein [Streptomyces sp. NPDC001982]|uniref:nuclear transport factor 2 family protein n=1 Tax=Streptomyces sp. NPDC001982 TaxID=3154405 RepID=UPI00331813B6
MNQSVVAKVQELSDRADLIDLIHRYASCIDSRDLEGLVACFRPDAIAHYNGGETRLSGHLELQQWFQTMLAGDPAAREASMIHSFTNITIALAGDSAEVNSVGFVHVAPADNTDSITVRGLRYQDKCYRTPQGWLIGERRHHACLAFSAVGRPIAEARRG